MSFLSIWKRSSCAKKQRKDLLNLQNALKGMPCDRRIFKEKIKSVELSVRKQLEKTLQKTPENLSGITIVFTL